MEAAALNLAAVKMYRKSTGSNLAGQRCVFDDAIVNVMVEHARALLEVRRAVDDDVAVAGMSGREGVGCEQRDALDYILTR